MLAISLSETPHSVYYTSILTVLSLERTNLPAFPRSYITAHGGPYMTPTAPIFIGATTAFVWDQSFVATVRTVTSP